MATQFHLGCHKCHDVTYHEISQVNIFHIGSAILSLHGSPFAGRASLSSRRSLELATKYIKVLYTMHSPFVQLIYTIRKKTLANTSFYIITRLKLSPKIVNPCKDRKIETFFPHNLFKKFKSYFFLHLHLPISASVPANSSVYSATLQSLTGMLTPHLLCYL